MEKTILIFIPAVLAMMFFLFGFPSAPEKLEWGINFSSKQAASLGINWKIVYSALLQDLKVKKIKLITHWDMIEPVKGQYYFEDLDWQIQTAVENNAEVLLVIGMKTPRWPECHLPEWAGALEPREQQKHILTLISKIISRYQKYPAITAWQVENEPFFEFGDCPWQDADFLEREIALVKTLDLQNRPVVISASGEWSLWLKEAALGDWVAISMYKIAWFPQRNSYIRYPFPPMFYWLKTQLVARIFKKEVFVGELQAEPWCPKGIRASPIDEQQKTMSFKQFQENIEFAKKTGIEEFYLWGAEWWFWMKEVYGDPSFWDEAGGLFLK